MRISELARRSGVSVPTIKYYLRTGLLPSGVATARNQAIYSDAHLRRLRLVRTLREIGGLTVRATRNVLVALHRSPPAGPEALSIISAGRSRGHRRAFHDVPDGAAREVATLVARQSWGPRAHQRDLNRIADVHVVAQLLDLPEVRELTQEYAGLAAEIAQRDVALAKGLATRLADSGRPHKAVLEEILVALVLSGALMDALHSIARESELGRLLADWTSAEPNPPSS